MLARKNCNAAKAHQTGTPSKYPQGYFKDKPCRWCATVFTPNAPSELYCSDACKDCASTDKYMRRMYKLSYQDYLKLHAEQGGKCKICGGAGFLMREDRHKLLLVIDHCHATGKVRGLLCHNCNRALGLLETTRLRLLVLLNMWKVQRLSERSRAKRLEAPSPS